MRLFGGQSDLAATTRNQDYFTGDQIDIYSRGIARVDSYKLIESAHGRLTINHAKPAQIAKINR